MGFIYKVVNNINGKIYIGKTVHSVERRIKEHKNEAHTNTKGRPFHMALEKYGMENFSFSMIEEVDNQIIDEREKYWINYYRSYIGFEDSNGYNATLGGDGTIKSDYEKIVKEYIKIGTKTKTAKKLNCSTETVRNACEYFKVPDINKSAGRTVRRIDDVGNIRVYNSIKQAAEEISNNLTKQKTIRKRITFVVNHRPNQRAYGYLWKAD